MGTAVVLLVPLLAFAIGYGSALDYAPQIGTVTCFRDYMDITMESFGGTATVVGNEGNSNCFSSQFPWTVRVYTPDAITIGRQCFSEQPTEQAGDDTKMQYTVTVRFLDAGSVITVHDQEQHFNCEYDKEGAVEQIMGVTPIQAITISLLAGGIPEMNIRFAVPQEGGSIGGEYAVIDQARSGDLIYLFVEVRDPTAYRWESIRVDWIAWSNNPQYQLDLQNGQISLQFFCNGCPDQLDNLFGEPVFGLTHTYHSEDTTLIIPYRVRNIGTTSVMYFRMLIQFCDVVGGQCTLQTQSECDVDNNCFELRGGAPVAAAPRRRQETGEVRETTEDVSLRIVTG